MDSLNAVLVDCVKALGGSKQVGLQLWPEKTPDAAQRLLLDCLNDDRAAHLTPESMMLVLRMAHAKGIHIGFEFMAASLGYAKPTPIEPRDEAAELQRQFIKASESMAAIVERMERLAPAAYRSPALRAA